MDQNLKLLILDNLFEKNSTITEQINAIKNKDYSDLVLSDDSKYEWFDKIPEVLSEIDNIEITDDMLGQVTYLSAESCETHFMVMPNWDGEGDDFNIKSLSGLEKMSNLESIEFMDLSDVSDQEFLLGLKLKTISEVCGIEDHIEESLKKMDVHID